MDTAIAFTAAESGVAYDFRDDFTTEEAAPLASPRTAEPGPGTLTITDTNQTFSINSSGEFVFAAGNSSWADHGIVTQQISSPSAGQILYHKINLNGTGLLPGMVLWSTDATLNITQYGSAVYWNSTARIFEYTSGAGIQVGVYSAATWYEVATTLRANGVHHFIKGGAYSAWTHLWVSGNGSLPANLWGIFNSYNQSGKLDNFRIPDSNTTYTPTPLASESFNRGDSTNLGSTDGAGAEESGGDGLAWTEVAGNWKIASNKFTYESDGGSGESFASVDAGTANIILQGVGNRSTSTNFSAYPRATNGDNAWEINYNGDNVVYMLDINAAVRTIRSSVASTVTASTNYNVIIVCDAASITAYKDGGSRVNYSSATFNQSETKHGIGANTPSQPVTWDNFVVWPRTVTDFPEV